MSTGTYRRRNVNLQFSLTFFCFGKYLGNQIHWLDEVQEMQRNTQKHKVFIKDEREGLQKLVRSAMLYGNEAWCLREKEMAIFRRTERAMILAMYIMKLLVGRNSEGLMDMLGIKESLDRMAKASSMRWYGHVLRKEDENVIVKALKF